MKLIRRFVVDVRGPDQDSPASIENTINEELTRLQMTEDGKMNPNIVIDDIDEVNKDSGVLVIIIKYTDKGLDNKK